MHDERSFVGFIQSILEGSAGQYLQGWYALIPPLLLVSYFAIGLVAFSVRNLVAGRYHDLEVETRGSSVLVGMWLRLFFVWVTRPLWLVVRSTGVPASAITSLSVILAFGAAAAVAAGRFALGGWLYLASGFCDFLDGRVARASGSSSTAGAALDSVLDRYSDAAILVGLAWYYRSSWVLFAALVGLVGTLMVPYVRARGEGLGTTVKVGLMQRPERVVYLGLSVAMSPVLQMLIEPGAAKPTMHLAIGGIVVVAFFTQVTTFQRLIYLLKALSKEVPVGFLETVTFIKYVVAAFLATALDFAAVIGLVSLSGAPPWVATAFGCALGGALNYSINRIWTFRSDGHPLPQGARYAFVSATSAAINAGGVAVLLLIPDLDYRVAWILVRITVFAGWNYPLQRNYVFVAENGADRKPVHDLRPRSSLF